LLKGELKAGAKQDVLSIYTGVILFAIEVEEYLLFVKRENRGRCEIRRGSNPRPI
jgi:hypothetical protein